MEAAVFILRNFDSSHINYYEKSWLFPSRLRVTRVAGAGGDGKGKGGKSLSLAFLLPITPRAPLERDGERRLGTSQLRGEWIIPNSIKVALAIGHWAFAHTEQYNDLLEWPQNNKSQCPITNAQSNLYWISYTRDLMYASSTRFRKTVRGARTRRLPEMSENREWGMLGDNREIIEIKIHVYGKLQTSVENLSK